MLERNVDETVKYALVHKDLTEFERSCALRDPEARAVFSAFDRTILFTAGAKPVRFVPPIRLSAIAGRALLPPPPPPEEFRRRPFGT